MNAVTKTPGYGCRLRIFFDLDKRGKRIAYRWSGIQLRAFRMKLDEADRFIGEGHADHLPCHPLKGPRG